MTDRVVQQSLKMVLEPIFEADLLPVSYGFRPKRRAHDVVAKIHYYGQRGYRWMLDADIERCFDHIDEDRAGRKALLTRSPALATTCRLVRDFAEIMVGRRCHEVQEWITRVRGDGSPALWSFAVGLLRDLDAVTAGLTLEYSSGPVEGHVNRIEMLNRQVYGRAHFDLPRKRVVH